MDLSLNSFFGAVTAACQNRNGVIEELDEDRIGGGGGRGDDHTDDMRDEAGDGGADRRTALPAAASGPWGSWRGRSGRRWDRSSGAGSWGWRRRRGRGS